MSGQNVEVVRRCYDALNRGDWDAARRAMHPDVELTTQRGPDAGTHRGREALERFHKDYIASFASHVFEPEHLLENGDQVVVLLTRRARLEGSSADIVVRNGAVWTVQEGKVLSIRSFPDPNGALEAAGLKHWGRPSEPRARR